MGVSWLTTLPSPLAVGPHKRKKQQKDRGHNRGKLKAIKQKEHQKARELNIDHLPYKAQSK
jgi:hypothetical protein